MRSWEARAPGGPGWGGPTPKGLRQGGLFPHTVLRSPQTLPPGAFSSRCPQPVSPHQLALSIYVPVSLPPPPQAGPLGQRPGGPKSPRALRTLSRTDEAPGKALEARSGRVLGAGAEGRHLAEAAGPSRPRTSLAGLRASLAPGRTPPTPGPRVGAASWAPCLSRNSGLQSICRCLPTTYHGIIWSTC